MKKYVIDASVVINSLIENNRDVRFSCKKIVDYCKDPKVKVFAPDSLKQEVANVLLMAVKDVDKARTFFDTFLDFKITYIRIDDSLLKKTLEIASAVHDTVYDATYHSLALSRSATFLTCDQKYFERAKGWGGVKVVK